MSEVSTTQPTKPAKPTTRPPAEIEADINVTRDRLVGTIAELEERVKPANLAAKGKAKVTSIYTSDQGMRWDRVAMTAGAVVAGLIGVRMASSTVRWALAVPKEKPVDADVVYLPVPKAQVGSLASLVRASA